MKFNKNIIVFVVVMVFLLAGFTMQYYDDLKYELISFAVQNADAAEDLPTLLSNIDEISTDKLRYHNAMMDLDSVKQRLLNTRVIKKSDTSMIVRTDCDSLIELQTERFTTENISAIVNNIAQLQAHAQSNGAEFLYVVAPRKTNAMEVPENVTDYRKENVAALIDELEKQKVNTLDLCQILDEEGRLDENLFFRTDHHWRPEVGFWAAGEICRDLNERYGFEYDTSCTDLSNYNITVYEDSFLGSYGKKVGSYFVSGGAEDFALITPKFKTDFRVSLPRDDEVQTGSFQDAILYKQHLGEDPYQYNQYAAYINGTIPHQTIKNNLNQEDEKIFIIQDSFGCVVTPFLSLQCSELHNVDIRDFFVGEPENVHDYIETFKPDYVILLYAGLEDLPDGCGRYNFNPS